MTDHEPSRTDDTSRSSLRALSWKFKLRVDRANREVGRIRVVRRFFLSYVLVLFVPILLSLAIYRESYVLAERQAQDDLEASIDRTSEFLTLRFQETRRLLGLLDTNTALRRMAYSSDEDIDADYFRLISLRNTLFPYSRVSTLINNYAVTFSAHGYVVTPSIAGRLEALYEDWFSSQFDDFDAFSSWLFSGSHEGRILPVERPSVFGNADTELVYVETLPIGLGARSVVLVELDTGALIDALELGTEGSVRGMGLYDSRGELLIGVGELDFTSGGLVLEREIPTHPLVVRGSYRIGTLSSYTRRVTLLIVGSVVLSTLIGIALARHLSRAQTRPLISLFQQLGRGVPTRDGASLSDAVQAILASHRQLERSIERQRPVVQAAVLGKMIRGDYHSAAALDRALSLAAIPAPAGASTVIAMSARFLGRYLSTDDSVIRESEAVGSVIRDVLSEYEGTWPYVVDDSVLAVICFCDLDDEEAAYAALKDRAADVLHTLRTEGGMDALVCMGPVVSDLLDLPRSYDEAATLHDRESARGRSGLYTALEHSSEIGPVSIDFPVSLENRIIASIKSGSGSVAARELRDVLQTNSAGGGQPDVVAATLRSQLLGMLYRVARGLSPQESAGTPERLEEIARIQVARADTGEELVDAALTLAAVFSGKKRSHNEILFESMKRVIDENLGNPDLSLAMIADRCSISEVYASQFFKEQAGEQFSRYVEMRRMDIARTLLANPSVQVKEVATAVGFRNVNSFTRAFKRSTRFTPTEFRSLS